MDNQSYYHVTSREIASKIESEGFLDDGVWFWNKFDSAWFYRDHIKSLGKEPEIIEVSITGKLYKLSEETDTRTAAWNKEFISTLKKDGYVGFIGYQQGDKITYVFNIKSLKVKSKL